VTGDRRSIIDNELIRLRQQYLNGLNDRVNEIEKLFRQLRSNAWDSQTLSDLQVRAHSLAGSGGTFGFDDISQKARNLDTYLKDCLLSNANLQESHFNTIAGQINKLQAACKAAINLQISNEHFSQSQKIDLAISDKPTVLILADDKSKAKELGEQISHYGYRFRVERTNDIKSADDVAYLSESPYVDGIIVMLEKDKQDVEKTIDYIKTALPLPRPIMFVNELGDIQVRLNAVRMGGDAFLVHPVEITQLIDKLDSCTRRGKFEAFRVLIVEDCESLALAYSIFLKRANFETRIITNPLNCLQAIVEFQPELILLDMYMPECSGSELAKVIRQQNHYDSVPIVFLSAEIDREKQLDALSLGGDDFLTKPISAQHLVAAVRIRAERYRELRSHMVRDSLTGLFNHTRTEEQLITEISRATRENKSLCYVMIDVDHFKAINDVHGHAVGDQVLKRLARLLTQSLRKTDIIGRYGGEEFALVLGNTDAANALNIIDKIRIGFNRIVHQSRLGDFNVSFSAGIAEFPRYNSAKLLHEAADNALYTCKNAGRNQVQLALDAKNVA